MKKKLALTFPRKLVSQPITYRLVKDYDLILNIIKAKITPYEKGRLDLEIEGAEEAIKRGVEFLESTGVEVQPLIQEIRWNQDKCTHCGVCVPLCPVSAFEIDRNRSLIAFNHDKCIACGICVQACPYRAIEIVF
jgi:ferredoxin